MDEYSVYAQGGANDQLRQAQEIADLSNAARLDQIDALEFQIKGLERVKSLSKEITQFTGSLRFSDLSPLSQQAQFNQAQSLFNTTLSSAKGGDVDAQGNLLGNAQAFLEEAQGFFGGATSQFSSVFNNVTGNLDALGLSSPQSDIQTLQSQLDSLRSIEFRQDRLESVTIDTSAQEVQALNSLDNRLGEILDKQNQNVADQAKVLKDQLEELKNIKANLEAQISQNKAISDRQILVLKSQQAAQEKKAKLAAQRDAA